nr:MAG TPA: hypothetical protein [Caudoviricetes sp.]
MHNSAHPSYKAISPIIMLFSLFHEDEHILNGHSQ